MEMSRCTSSNSKSKVKVEKKFMNCTNKGIEYMSYLPEDILLHIISLMPPEMLIVISLVSKQWQNLVLKFLSKVSLSLNLNETDTSIMTKTHLNNPQSTENSKKEEQRMKFVQFVDRTLFLHMGCTINHLRLCFHCNSEDSYTKRTDNWVQSSFTNNIEELELNFRDKEESTPGDMELSYELPDGSFDSKILRALLLNFCKLRESTFKISHSLIRLALVQVEIIGCCIGDIVLKLPVLEDFNLESCICPEEFMFQEEDIMLKKLSIINCRTRNLPMVCIDLSTPCLEIFAIVGRYLHSSFIRNATQLIDVLIDIRQINADHVQGDNIGILLAGLNHCKNLTITSWCIQVLPTGDNFLLWMPTPFHYVKNLNLQLGLSKQELPGIACLLRTCINLESLSLFLRDPFNVDWDVFIGDIPDVFSFDETTFWESQTIPFHCLQRSLKKITLNGFFRRYNEIKIFQFLMANARVLESFEFLCVPTSFNRNEQMNMRIVYRILHAMINFPRASPIAKVIFPHNPDLIV